MEKNSILSNKNLKLGFTQVPNCVVFNPKIARTAKLIYIILLSYDWEKETCYPSHESIGRQLGLCTKAVHNNLKILRDFGLIQWKRKGYKSSNLYRTLYIPEEVIEDAENARAKKSKEKSYNKKLISYNNMKRTSDKEDSIKEDSIKYNGTKNKLFSSNNSFFLVNQLGFLMSDQKYKELLAEINAINYYCLKYEEKTGNPHPALKVVQLEKILNKMQKNEIVGKLSFEEWQKMIDRWFKMRIKTDYNINHFLEGKNLEHRFYEVLYYN